MSLSRKDFLKSIGATFTVAGITGCDAAEADAKFGGGMGVTPKETNPDPTDYNSIYYVQVNRQKCQRCSTCANLCPTGIIKLGNGGKGKAMIPDPRGCMNCGQCLVNCPNDAIYENVSFDPAIQAAIADPDTTVIAMTAPAVRYALGESFGLSAGTYSGGQMVSALKALGFDLVWDAQYTADLTIFEEATELVKRITGEVSKPLPQFTSCCPAWIKYVESFYPDLLPNVSSCKSPIAMLGSLAKTYGADKKNISASKIFTVSVMPCVAKKYEGLRPEMNDSGFRDINATITTRELADMISRAGISYTTLPENSHDALLGTSTGAATIFGATGGVTEAALRYAYEAVSGQTLTDLEFEEVRGTDNVREAAIAIPNGPTLKVCIVSGLSSAAQVCDEVMQGNSPYHLIEVMACPGGCVNGGGQPLQ